MMGSDKHPATTSELLESLRKLREDNPKAVKATVHLYPTSIYAPELQDDQASSSSSAPRKITSWKMTEHMYFQSNNNFPTLARGLFTEEVDGEERIVARGYDKFFNTDEVAWSYWDGMKHHTQGPYHLTLKSNGCLILISALSPKHLVVASKHSLGTTTETKLGGKDEVDGVLTDGVAGLAVKEDNGKGKGKAEDEEHLEAKAHAEVGRIWLRRTLQKSGKAEEDLARRLWDEGLTAVLELCDDSFEEHVIATPVHWTGLHLHGLNTNTPYFNTLPPDQVSTFAQEFGFIPTKYVTLETLDEVRTFSKEVSESGSWEGEMIEGFVVRSTVRDTGSSHLDSKPPYPPGTPFFFKVKFEEPYLLYRTWREVTRAMLPLLKETGGEEEEKIRKRVKNKTKRPEVAVYVGWVDKMLRAEPELFENFERGVVKVRERFLKWIEGEGKAEWEAAISGKPLPKVKQDDNSESTAALRRQSKIGMKKKYVLVPMAIPGCGKTLIGNALQHLFDFGHTQSDDVTAKKTAPTFLKNIAALLAKKDIVYADRNNHYDKHYEELLEMPFNTKLGPGKILKDYDVRFIAIKWNVDEQPYHRVLRICSERVVQRGDNHQTLRPDMSIEAEHEAIVGQFLRKFTSPDPEDFDRIIGIEVEDQPRVALEKVVDGIVDILGLTKPTSEALDDALRVASEYKPKTPYHAPAKISKAIRYFGLAPEIDLSELVSTILAKSPSTSAEALFSEIKTNRRITAKPHVTLSHEKNVEAEREALGPNVKPGPHQRCWDQCKTLATEADNKTSMYRYNITHLVWDDRVMSLIIDELHPCEAGTVQLEIPEDYAKHLHITVGTRTDEISAFESRGIVAVAQEGIAKGDGDGDGAEAVEGGGRVRWMAVYGMNGEGRIRGMW